MAQKKEKNQKWMVFSLGIIATVSIGVSAHLLTITQGTLDRSIASIPTTPRGINMDVDFNSAHSSMNKQEILLSKNRNHKHLLSKALGHISSKVEKHVDSDEDRLILKGFVSVTKDIPELKIKWILGDLAEVLDGETEHTLLNLKAGETHEFSIELKEKELNQRIYLFAFEEIDGENYGYIDQFNSRPNLLGGSDKVRASSVDGFKIDMTKQRVQF